MTARLAHGVEEERRAIIDKGAKGERGDAASPANGGGRYYIATSHRPASYHTQEDG